MEKARIVKYHQWSLLWHSSKWKNKNFARYGCWAFRPHYGGRYLGKCPTLGRVIKFGSEECVATPWEGRRMTGGFSEPPCQSQKTKLTRLEEKEMVVKNSRTGLA